MAPVNREADFAWMVSAVLQIRSIQFDCDTPKRAKIGILVGSA